MMFTSFGATYGFLGCFQLVIKISVERLESQNWIRQFEENLFGNAKLFLLSKWDVGKFLYYSFNCPVSSFLVTIR